MRVELYIFTMTGRSKGLAYTVVKRYIRRRFFMERSGYKKKGAVCNRAFDDGFDDAYTVFSSISGSFFLRKIISFENT